MPLDIQKILSKLPFSTTGIPGELHWKNANWCGPGTSLESRLNPDDTPKDWSLPVNSIDQAAYKHDLIYRDAGDDLATKHQGDREMIKALEEIQPGDLGERFQRFIVKKILQLKLRYGLGLNNDMAKTLAKELHSPIRHKFQRRMIISMNRDEIHTGDLAENVAGNKFVLINIDVFSRFAWLIPIKNKNSDTLIAAFTALWKIIDKPKKLWWDEEKGMYSNKMKDFLKENNVELYHTYSELKASIAERFIRTMREYIARNLCTLEKFIEHYNNSEHSTIKMSPADARKDLNQNKLRELFMEKYMRQEVKDPKYKVGDRVRLYSKRYLFEKKSVRNRWTEEIFTVKEVHQTIPPTYTIVDEKGEALLGKCYEYELLKTQF